jgi:hypothetical protein
MLISLKKLFNRKKSIVNPMPLRCFNSKFPNAKHVFWKQVDVLKWQVHFSMEKIKYSALFNSHGKWMETVSAVTLDKTPKPIKHKFQEKFKKEGNLQIHHVQSPNKSLYEMKWYNGIYVVKLLYDITGKIVGRVIT